MDHPEWRLLIKVFIVAIGLCFSLLVDAGELEVIYDSGDTLPINRHIRKERPPIKIPSQNDIEKLGYPLSLPITTPSMQPGKVAPTPVNLPYMQTPLFIVGSDPQSTQWLQDRRLELIQLGAVGLLVEAKTMQDIAAIKQLATGLRLLPASAEAISQRLNLHYYPVLIYKNGWEQ